MITELTRRAFLKGLAAAAGYVAASGATAHRAGAKAAQLISSLPLVVDASGSAPISLTMVATGIGGAATAYVALVWLETY